MQGRLKSFSVETTQGHWSFDVSAVTGAPTAQPHPPAHPQPFVGPDANLVNKNNPPVKRVQQPHAECSHARDIHQRDDDDDFMDPRARHPIPKKQCTNAGVGITGVDKVQYSNFFSLFWCISIKLFFSGHPLYTTIHILYLINFMCFVGSRLRIYSSILMHQQHDVPLQYSTPSSTT